MKAWRSVLIVGVLAIIGGLFVALIQAPLRDAQVSLAKTVTALELETAEIEKRLLELTSKNTSQEFPRELLWYATSRADAELTLQKTATKLVNSEKLRVISIRNMSSARDTINEIVSINFEIEGSMEAFYLLLSELEQQNPRVAVETLRVRPMTQSGVEDGSINVLAQLVLWAYWTEAP